MARVDVRKADGPPKQLVQAIRRLSGSKVSARDSAPDDGRLYDSHCAILRAYRALVAAGLEPGRRWRAPVDAALRYLGGGAERSSQSLRDYDHHRYGPFLGVSDEGGAATVVRRAALASPKVEALGKGKGQGKGKGKAKPPPPLAVGVALDAERLGAVGEVPVGPHEFADIWQQCVDRTLLTTNVGGRVHLWLYRLAPVVMIPGGDADAALAAAKAGLEAAFKPFLTPAGGKPRWLVVFVEFELGSRRTDKQKKAMLRALRRYVEAGKIAARRVHHLGLNVRIGWGAKGRNAAIQAIDLARAVGIQSVTIDGVVRKEADRVVSFPGLLNYLPPENVAEVLEHAARKGVRVHPLKQVDTDTVARSIWSVLSTARRMGLDLGKYGCFPLTLAECDVVVTQIQRWFPDWSAAPVFYVDQGLIGRTQVYVGSDRAKGLEVWLRMVAKHRVKVVLIDTIDKAEGWKILRTDGDPKGLLEASEIARLSALGARLGIKVLWAGGVTLPQAYEFGKLGVFGIYVTTAAAEAVPVTGRYRRDPSMASGKRATFNGVLTAKTVLEAGYLGERLRSPSMPDRVRKLGDDIASAGLDPQALSKILPAAWLAWWRMSARPPRVSRRPARAT